MNTCYLCMFFLLSPYVPEREAGMKKQSDVIWVSPKDVVDKPPSVRKAKPQFRLGVLVFRIARASDKTWSSSCWLFYLDDVSVVVVFLFTVFAIRFPSSRRCYCFSFVTHYEDWIIRKKQRNLKSWAVTNEGNCAERFVSRATDGPTFWAGPPLRNDGGSRTNKHKPIVPLCSKRLMLRSPPWFNPTESVNTLWGVGNKRACVFHGFSVPAQERVIWYPRVFFVLKNVIKI